MSELTTVVNIFNQTERKVRCIANEHDYLGDGTIIKEEHLEVGKEYIFIKGEARSFGMMVHLKGVPEENNYGYQSYLFEEIEPYEKNILREEIAKWLCDEVNKSMQTVKFGRTYTLEEIKEHYGFLEQDSKEED